MHWHKCLEMKDPVYSGYDDRYGFYGIEELAIEIIEQSKGELELKDFPKRFFKCDITWLSTDVTKISRKLFEGESPETIVEGMIKDLYTLSNMDFPNCYDLIGFKEIEASFSKFTTANYYMWIRCRNTESYDPGVQSVGIEKLQDAIDKFSEDNKAIGLWTYNDKKPIELDEYFWRFKVFPRTKAISAPSIAS